MADFLINEALLSILAEVVYVRFSEDGRINSASVGFAKLLKDAVEPVGRNIDEFFEKKALDKAIASGIEGKLAIRAGNVAHTLVGRIRPVDGSYVLIGAKALLSVTDLIEKMARAENELIALNRKYQTKIAELEQAENRIETLTGLLPICANCKNIRNDKGEWEQVELYVSKRSGADFSHGICPKCMKILYPDFTE